MTFALLIYRTAQAAETLPRADEEAALSAHRALQNDLSARGALHAVARLEEARTARTVQRRGSAHDITDGPYIETKEWLVGFYVLDCADEDEALRRARQICADDSHTIEVRPVRWRWAG